MRNPWIIAQLAAAAVLLVVSLIGIIGTLVGVVELAFSFQGAIQAWAVFPGLVVSLIVNALIMRAQRSDASTLQKVLLIAEGVVVAALLVFHFYTDPAGNTFGLAIIGWPVLIVLAITIAVVGIVRIARARGEERVPVPQP